MGQRATTKERPLTDRERRLAEAWAADPEHNGTAAARAAGYGGGVASLRVTAHRVLTRANVRAYIAELTREAVTRAEAEREKSVASLRECLEYLTTVMRSRLADYLDADGGADHHRLKEAPAGLVRRYQRWITTTEEGQVIERTQLELESALAAAQQLVAHHQRRDDPSPPPPTVNIALVLRQLPEELLERLLLAIDRAAAERPAQRE